MTEEERLKYYDQCKECNEINTYSDWCRTCNSSHFREGFTKWTSGNKEIDYFIQNTQIHAWNRFLVLEWYPWENFSEMKEIGKGGYATVFRAKTKVGRINKWDHQSNQWRRGYNYYVALKTMEDSDQKTFFPLSFYV